MISARYHKGGRNKGRCRTSFHCDEPVLHLEQDEARLVARDDEVTIDDNLRTATERKAVHGGDNGLHRRRVAGQVAQARVGGCVEDGVGNGQARARRGNGPIARVGGIQPRCRTSARKSVRTP